MVAEAGQFRQPPRCIQVVKDLKREQQVGRVSVRRASAWLAEL